MNDGVDLSEPASLGKLVADALSRFGRIDALVHTVGAWRGGKPVHEDDLANWDFLFNANLRTTLLCCRAVIPQMLKQRRGKIITVASRDGLKGSAGYAAYSVSKSAVLRLTESLADAALRHNAVAVILATGGGRSAGAPDRVPLPSEPHEATEASRPEHEALLERAPSEGVLATRVMSSLGFYVGKLEKLLGTWELMLAQDAAVLARGSAS